MVTIKGSQFDDNDTVNGDPSIFRPSLVGTQFDDWIYGYAGNDILEGGDGFDFLYGGTGDDIYIIKNNPNQFIGENKNQGHDTVFSGISHYLSVNVESLILVDDAYEGFGNSLNNYIQGNDADNALYGDGGNDRMVGGLGFDSLDGGFGNDSLEGDSSDILSGGPGNDFFNVQSPSVQVIEYYAAGRDTVGTVFSYILGENIENLELLYNDNPINGTGNSLSNMITGNHTQNRLFGVGGNDKLVGADGDDYLDGGAGRDDLNGGEGADVLVGGAGIDALTGGGSADRFTLNFYPASNSTADSIQDFKQTEADKIVIAGGNSWAIRSYFAYNLSTGILSYDDPFDGITRLNVAQMQPNTAFDLNNDLVFT